MVHPVAQAVGMAVVDLADSHVDREAVVDLVLSHVGREDDAHGQDVVDLVEGDVLLLHLVPDRERRLDARLDFVFESHLVEGRTDGRREVAEEFVALCLRLLQLLRDVLIDLRCS